ncbi:ABC transporter ATP-binding protein [Chryseolinea sp. T2]|uniref:ABC transporter ATP-binding protein n=1 Tax=Chryseolinea sp. T2 TaxID=3129255 RepID=UPI00307853F6
MRPILEVRNIAKLFKISHQSAGYLSLRERLLGVFRGEGLDREDFWALKNISFDVAPGESLGVIGRNGAGKSTLLKILSRITPPTKGRIVARGRIASLLEVGTGFHPELTGRENIYFNGSLLGMMRREIEGKFDEIVDFSGVEKFLDTPLKHYSSGMQLRLAFAVAAFLEPEILIIDEVLAVGDVEFQKKCMNKMESVAKGGSSLLFVSHQLGLVSKLCKNTILLGNGTVLAQGESSSIIDKYMDSVGVNNEFSAVGKANAQPYFFKRVRTLSIDGASAATYSHAEEICIEANFGRNETIKNVHLLAAVNNKNGQRIFSSDICLDDYTLSEDENTFKVTIPRSTLTPGTYSLLLALHIPNTVGYDMKDQICQFSIYDGGSEFTHFENRWFYGDVFVRCRWELVDGNNHQ